MVRLAAELAGLAAEVAGLAAEVAGFAAEVVAVVDSAKRLAEAGWGVGVGDGLVKLGFGAGLLCCCSVSYAGASPRYLALPKSISFRCPDAESIRFSGLRSRCTTCQVTTGFLLMLFLEGHMGN